jgi:hypothetical protein
VPLAVRVYGIEFTLFHFQLDTYFFVSVILVFYLSLRVSDRSVHHQEMIGPKHVEIDKTRL